MSSHNDGTFCTCYAVNAHARMEIYLCALTCLDSISYDNERDLLSLFDASLSLYLAEWENADGDEWCSADIIHNWWCSYRIGHHLKTLPFRPLELWAFGSELATMIELIGHKFEESRQPWHGWCRK